MINRISVGARRLGVGPSGRALLSLAVVVFIFSSGACQRKRAEPETPRVEIVGLGPGIRRVVDSAKAERRTEVRMRGVFESDA